jgi:hypothetical protein
MIREGNFKIGAIEDILEILSGFASSRGLSDFLELDKGKTGVGLEMG